MKLKKLFHTGHTYRKKLITIFTALSFLFCVPFAFFLYHSSKTQILNTLEASNEQNLQQIKYNYELFNDIMANLCFSVYLNNDTKELLYNPSVTYMEGTEHINYLKSTILNIYPAVYSISIYNGVQKKFYSTLTDSSQYLASLTSLLDNTEKLPKLQPILRKIPNQAGTGELYVFSYLLYDFETEDQKPLSYIVFEQNASWLTENFRMLNRSDTTLYSHLYLLDQDGNICSQASDSVSDIDNELLKKVYSPNFSSEQNNGFTSYTETFHSEKYFITKLALNSSGDSLVMIQNYRDVFTNLEHFQKTFRILTIVWLTIFVLVSWQVSNRLYAPVKKILSFVSDLSGHTPDNSNEFQQLTALYKDSYDKLAKQDTTARSVLKHYQLEKLLTDGSGSVWQGFISYAPNHWLVTETQNPVRIFRLSFDRRKSDGHFWSDDDLQLFLFSAHNILSELLEKECKAEVFLTGTFSVYGIIQTSVGDCDLVLENALLEVQKYFKKYLLASFDSTYSSAVSEASKISELYPELEAMHEYHYIYGPGAVINVQTCRKNLENTTEFFPESLLKRCITAIKHSDAPKALNAVTSIFASLQDMRVENTRICIMALANQINFALKEMCSAKGILTRMHFEQIYSRLDTAQYLDEARLYLTEYIEQAFSVFSTKKEEDKEQLFIRNIQNYILANYNDVNLSSQLIGDQFHLSAKYIMKRFLSYSGISLNDYINEVRMNQAAVLLKTSTMSVGEVAVSVGMLNENYFYRLFKKTYGCTPREYASKQDAE